MSAEPERKSLIDHAREMSEPLPTFEEKLETCLLHGSVDDVVQMLHDSGESSYVLSGITLDQTLHRFESRDPIVLVATDALGIERPQVLARCLYEFEQRDEKRGAQLMEIVTQECRRSDHLHQRLFQVLPFLERLREEGKGGSDGGAGDRHPRVPHGPHDTDAIELDVPRDESDEDTGVFAAVAHG